MRAGQVSSVQDSIHRMQRTEQRRKPEVTHDEGFGEPQSEPRSASKEPHHWHLSDLLHPFAHRKAG